MKPCNRSDGTVFESKELDYIFLFMKGMNIDGLSFDEAPYPDFLHDMDSIIEWKIHNTTAGKRQYRVVHISDP
jgi:hypothetical protein